MSEFRQILAVAFLVGSCAGVAAGILFAIIEKLHAAGLWQ